MKTYSVFLVSQKGLDSIELLDAAFDSRESAEAYAMSYKTFMEPDITEVVINPPYEADPSRDCYYVEINMADRSVQECYIANTLMACAYAAAGKQNVETADGEERLCMYVLAENEREAIAAALGKYLEQIPNKAHTKSIHVHKR